MSLTVASSNESSPAVAIIRRQLRCLFGELSPETEQRLTLADSLQLEAWAESILQAKSLDEVFNDAGMGRFLDYKYPEENFSARIQRICDRRYCALRKNSISISFDYPWPGTNLFRSTEKYQDLLEDLARFYAAFRQTYGESGHCYDDWKGAFSFTFEIQVSNNGFDALYLLNVANWRSSIEFRFSKVIDPADTGYDRMIYHPPCKDFPEKLMNGVSAYLYGYAEGYWSVTIARDGEREFLKWVDSNLILFGYQAGQYFEQEFDDPDIYDEKKKARLQGLQNHRMC